MAKNLCGKTRKATDPYETWKSYDGTWTWLVLKKYSANDDAPFARWFCLVKTPYVPEGELGDVYVTDVKKSAMKVG